jgi:hypothetical protein
VARVVTEATRPPQWKTRWSIRSMSRHAGVSPSTVQRIWSKNDLKPHRLKTFKLSNDPKFEEKFWDVIGLYLDPPTKALVLCCDEKSQCPGARTNATRASAGADGLIAIHQPDDAEPDMAKCHAPIGRQPVRRIVWAAMDNGSERRRHALVRKGWLH